jgi:hypothetical protein
MIADGDDLDAVLQRHVDHLGGRARAVGVIGVGVEVGVAHGGSVALRFRGRVVARSRGCPAKLSS